MKSVVSVLLIAASGLGLVACSQDSGGVQSSKDAADLFQQRSILRVGLRHKIALTIDDGPTRGVTEPMLDYLRAEGIKATFFVQGKQVRGQEATLKKMMDHGHVIANHTFEHPNLPKLVAEQGWPALRAQVAKTNTAIEPYTQPGGRLYFRAPGGAWQAGFADYLNQDSVLREYIGPIYWDIGGDKITRRSDGSVATAADWRCWSAGLTVDECAQGYLNETDLHDGGIVLMHDLKGQSVQMLKKLIPEWRRRGYTFVTLDEIDYLDRYATN
ncbi:MAG TPA: polysaccharide deacetylase family protein [Bdellovibrionales bacterium]|jgi:peptidoglycan/xylan/chitin deacetylase (PgdA/CDA1 family)|nr:polysaccharide deacetylase family protein [Bdellovibrionales bacterium]